MRPSSAKNSQLHNPQFPLTFGRQHTQEPIMDNLTFGDIFKIFPRLPSVKTPEVNRKIIVPSGITPLKNADQFRVIYKEGKQLLRTKPWVNGEFVDVRNDQFPLERLSIRDDDPSVEELLARVQVLFH